MQEGNAELDVASFLSVRAPLPRMRTIGLETRSRHCKNKVVGLFKRGCMTGGQGTVREVGITCRSAVRFTRRGPQSLSTAAHDQGATHFDYRLVKNSTSCDSATWNHGRSTRQKLCGMMRIIANSGICEFSKNLETLLAYFVETSRAEVHISLVLKLGW